MIHYYILILAFINLSCAEKDESKKEPISKVETTLKGASLVILGTVQDAGSPQINCKKECCAHLFDNPDEDRKVISLGLIDSENHRTYLFEATPDIGAQMKTLTQFDAGNDSEMVDGIFLTHGHIGHYTGLMYLGKEAMDARNTPVYTMPRMNNFLSQNGPWDQLVKRKNILLMEMANEKPIRMSSSIEITPILVPHRDEYSETVGYRITGPNKSALFIPDIDKWERWEKDIIDEIRKVDYAFLDATFYSGEELNNRDISEIPHPFVIESFETFKDLSPNEKNKIVFIHFNHTNPLLNPKSEESQLVIEKGFRIGKMKDVFKL